MLIYGSWKEFNQKENRNHVELKNFKKYVIIDTFHKGFWQLLFLIFFCTSYFGYFSKRHRRRIKNLFKPINSTEKASWIKQYKYRMKWFKCKLLAIKVIKSIFSCSIEYPIPEFDVIDCRSVEKMLLCRIDL